MVPHIRVEEALSRIVGAGEDELKVGVTAVPDERKGERLVVLHTKLDRSPEQICRELAAAGLPNLWIPSPDSFMEVEQIPVLGTGKFDLKGMKEVALKRFS
jgi:acyl-[acyl-carrier-protein]-phospholipid O-acyltransferase/long-chain-fatty-acid--[acyl-carrier-protein] ligase